jgi:polyhydroxyalkanoate synthesis regulator protein
LQIILEEEAGGLPMFSEMVLANLIRFYGHSMQGLMGNYLENNVQNLLDLQHQIAAQSQSLTPEIWTQALSQSNPFVQNLMFNYSQQTKQMFLQIQEQMLNAIGVKR